MTNLEVQTLTGLIQRTHQIVYAMANRGQRDDVYRQNLDMLSQAVAQGSVMMSAGQREIGGSSARIGERPPGGVSVDTWRNFVRQFTAARTTWFNETGSGVALSTTTGGSSMALDARSVTAHQQAVLTATRQVMNLRAGDPALPGALSNLRIAANNRARDQVNNYAQTIGLAWNSSTLLTRPPAGVTPGAWTALLQAIQGAQTMLAQYPTTVGGTARATGGAAATAAQPATAQPAATKAGPAAVDTPAAPRTTTPRARPRQAASGGGGSAAGGGAEPDMFDAARAAAAPITEVGGQALDTARGTFSALRDVGTLLTGAPADILGGGVTTPLRMADRLLAIATVLNPPSVSIYQRPWFWPTILGVGGYLGYSYYKSTQKPAAKADAAKKRTETAATLPALTGAK